LGPTLESSDAVKVLIALALATAYAVAAWRGAIFRDFVIGNMRIAWQVVAITVPVLWFMLGIDIAVGAEAVLRIRAVGADAEFAWQPYLVAAAMPFWALGFSVLLFHRPRRAVPTWFRDAWESTR
jgi:hypothetical protein